MDELFSRLATFHVFMIIGIVFFVLGSARILPFSSQIIKIKSKFKDCSKICFQTSILWGLSVSSLFLAMVADSNGLDFTLANFPGILLFCGLFPGLLFSIGIYWGLKIGNCKKWFNQ